MKLVSNSKNRVFIQTPSFRLWPSGQPGIDGKDCGLIGGYFFFIKNFLHQKSVVFILIIPIFINKSGGFFLKIAAGGRFFTIFLVGFLNDF